MKIAQIAPLYESVPPKFYGGTERIVHYLTEELVRLGHEVTLYASGDSETCARLVPQCPRSLRLEQGCIDQIAHHVLMVERLCRDAPSYDIIHSHIDYFPYSLMRRIRTPCLTTLHGRLDLPDLVPLYLEFRDIPVVSISDAQRGPLPWINWQGTIHHGIAEDAFTFRRQQGGYLAFLGRTSPEKGPEQAIEIAKRTGMPLKIAAKVDAADREYFETSVKPLLGHPLVEFLGEIPESAKNDFLGGAYALLFPIDWPEPFGLVMIEAMACGTPVIARANGSVPEVLEDGVTGFIADSIDEAARAVGKAGSLSREKCRRVFEERFTARRMALDYLALYQTLIEPGKKDTLRGAHINEGYYPGS
ncbi:MAG: glycosyltransferase family 4 protein [Endomicrobiales bacterium]